MGRASATCCARRLSRTGSKVPTVPVLEWFRLLDSPQDAGLRLNTDLRSALKINGYAGSRPFDELVHLECQRLADSGSPAAAIGPRVEAATGSAAGCGYGFYSRLRPSPRSSATSRHHTNYGFSSGPPARSANSPRGVDQESGEFRRFLSNGGRRLHVSDSRRFIAGGGLFSSN